MEAVRKQASRDSAAKADLDASFGYSRGVSVLRNLCLTSTILALGVLRAAPANAVEGLLRGPHPFLKENAVIVGTGLAAAAGGTPGGLKLKAAFEYELVGSLWLSLQLGLIDGSDQPFDRRPCPSCGRSADTMVGLTYRLRMDVPIILSGTLAAGFVFVFPDASASAMGMGARPAVSARYFLFDWLGFGLELGALLGYASHDTASGLSRTLASLDALLAVEVQFDTP